MLKGALLKLITPAATLEIQLSVCDENQPKLQWNMLSIWNPLKAVATRVATAKPKTMWTMLHYTFFSKPQADVCGSIFIKWNRSFDLLCNHSVILKRKDLFAFIDGCRFVFYPVAHLTQATPDAIAITFFYLWCSEIACKVCQYFAIDEKLVAHQDYLT